MAVDHDTVVTFELVTTAAGHTPSKSPLYDLLAGAAVDANAVVAVGEDDTDLVDEVPATALLAALEAEVSEVTAMLEACLFV